MPWFRYRTFYFAACAFLLLVSAAPAAGTSHETTSPRTATPFVNDDGTTWIPLGFNYACEKWLLEDAWETSRTMIAEDFQEMKSLGANVVRIHLQFGKFMRSPEAPEPSALQNLRTLLDTAERSGLRLDVTGLACYRPADVPEWYDILSEMERWNSQAAFWKAVAGVCSGHRGLFCYNLMNEPVVPGKPRNPGQWYSGALLGGLDFVQFISLDPGGRDRHDIALEWIRLLRSAIRTADPATPITVGLLPLGPAGGDFAGFARDTILPELDFLSVHVYPETGKLDDALDILRRLQSDKPLLLEETFALSCSASDLQDFIEQAKPMTSGFVYHYWGQTPEELDELKRAGKLTLPQALMRETLTVFQRMHAAPHQGKLRDP